VTELWATLAVKSTVVLAAAGVVSLVSRGASAAMRHMIWLTALSALLLLPLGLMFPQSAATPALISRAGVAASPVLDGAGSPATGAWIAVIWLSGVGVFLSRLTAAALRGLRLMREARLLERDAGIEILTNSEVAGAAAWGLLRKAVLLPPAGREWEHSRVRAVVLHEKAHLERQDCWALLVAELACALYWFHPLVWFAARQMRREQEHAADDRVLLGGLPSAEYAGHLVAIAKEDGKDPLMTGAITRSELTARVEAILDPGRKRTMLTRRMLLGSAAALVMIALPLAAVQAQKTYRVGEEGVKPPALVFKQEPSYTEQAKDAKIQGPVTLSAVIERDGKVYDVEVEEGLDPGLDANAVAAIQSWLFKPAEKDGKPVPVSVTIVVNFRLL
jgi:TonB family protein